MKYYCDETGINFGILFFCLLLCFCKAKDLFKQKHTLCALELVSVCGLKQNKKVKFQKLHATIKLIQWRYAFNCATNWTACECSKNGLCIVCLVGWFGWFRLMRCQTTAGNKKYIVAYSHWPGLFYNTITLLSAQRVCTMPNDDGKMLNWLNVVAILLSFCPLSFFLSFLFLFFCL